MPGATNFPYVRVYKSLPNMSARRRACLSGAKIHRQAESQAKKIRCFMLMRGLHIGSILGNRQPLQGPFNCTHLLLPAIMVSATRRRRQRLRPRRGHRHPCLRRRRVAAGRPSPREPVLGARAGRDELPEVAEGGRGAAEDDLAARGAAAAAAGGERTHTARASPTRAKRARQEGGGGSDSDTE